MKYKSYILVIITSVIMIINSCEKDTELIEDQTINIQLNQKYELPTELKTDLKQKNGLVIFQNKEQFDKITNLLEEETEKYINSYFSKFDKDASIEEINNQVDKDKFNPNVVYEAFEEYHSITSLRSRLVELEDEWLDHETLEGNSPLNHTLSERCWPIANTSGEYQIGETIYRAEKSGVIYEIGNSDYETLNQIRNNPKEFLNYKSTNSNLIIHNPEAAYNLKSTEEHCWAFVREEKTLLYNWHGIGMIIDLDWDGYGSTAKAKTLAYRKKKRLFGYKWAREWTSMTAFVHVADHTYNCELQDTYNSGINYRDWAYYVTAKIYGSLQIIRTRKGGYFYGQHSTGSVSTKTLVYN